jgi:hypothetical protein
MVQETAYIVPHVRTAVARLLPRRLSLQVELQQTGKYLRVIELTTPTVGVEDGCVQGRVRIHKPRGSLIDNNYSQD